MASERLSRLVQPRIHSWIVLGICLSAMPSLARAENKCPWLNEATASGLLGGYSTGSYTEPSPEHPAVCAFVWNGEGGVRTLTLDVEVVSEPHARLESMIHECGTATTPMQAIGNEAAICLAEGPKKSHGRRVVGRVRDQVFTLTIFTSLKNDSVLNRDALESKIYTAAEQVSGNLF